MGFKSAFKSFGKGLVKGALAGGKVLAKVDDIPFAGTAIAMIPIAGPILAKAADMCDMAENVFPDPGSADKKKQWARSKLRTELLKMGIEEKYLDDLISVGFLVKEGVVTVVGVPEEEKTEEKVEEKTEEPVKDKPAAEPSEDKPKRKNGRKKGRR